MNKIKIVLFNLVLIAAHSYSMEEWIRTNLPNWGIVAPKPAPTEELKQIIDRQGTFKNTELKKLQELIAGQADVNVVGHDGKTTPLLVAINDATNDEQDLLKVRLLAEFVRADINKRYAPNGLTPLAIAAHEGKAAVIPILLRFGADIRTRDDQGNTPLMLATRLTDQNKAEAVAQKLLEAGIDINAQNTAGETALYRAVQKKNYPLIEFLVVQGANRRLANTQGQTPLALATANADQTAVNLLSPQVQKLK